MSRTQCVVVFVMSLFTAGLHAQSTNASLTGRIIDPSNALIAGATIAAIRNDTNVQYETTTNALGEYYLTNLQPSLYRIEIEKSGFKRLIKPDVILRVQDALEIDFQMTVGSASES